MFSNPVQLLCVASSEHKLKIMETKEEVDWDYPAFPFLLFAISCYGIISTYRKMAGQVECTKCNKKD